MTEFDATIAAAEEIEAAAEVLASDHLSDTDYDSNANRDGVVEAMLAAARHLRSTVPAPARISLGDGDMAEIRDTIEALREDPTEDPIADAADLVRLGTLVDAVETVQAHLAMVADPVTEDEAVQYAYNCERNVPADDTNSIARAIRTICKFSR